MPEPPYCAATYAPIEQTCPSSCLFFAKAPNGVRPCYADTGFTKFTVRRMEDNAKGLAPAQVASLEADAIDRSFSGEDVPQDGARGGRDLRLHVSGDCRTDGAASILSGAATRWRLRRGGSVWTYTHAWRDVLRVSWGPDISVLASVENPADVELARSRGYATAIVVDRFPQEQAYDFKGARVLPCPAETRALTCVECRLCLDRDLNKLGITIGFSAHGMGAVHIRKRLPVLYPTPIEVLCE